jgi:transposase
MFFPEGAVRVHVYGRPVDMRKSFDGLYALTRQALGCDPLSGELFVFINGRGTQMAKRLEEGRFVSNWAHVSTRQMDWTGLKLLLEGIEPARYKRRCQGEPNFPHLWESKIPHPVQASASSGRTRPAFNFSFSRYELPRMFSVTA